MDVFGPNTREYTGDWDLPARKQKGWVHEVEVPLRKGESLGYETDHPEAGLVEFNVHSHQGKEVTYHAKGSEARMAGTFVAPWDGKFYLMWENLSGARVRVRARASRQG